MDNPASILDHTLLNPLATEAQIQQLCEEAVENSFASVCIPPSYVALATDRLYGTDVAVCTVIGFPLGYADSACKVHEAATAVHAGATEIDMVIQQGWAAMGEFGRVETEIWQVAQAIPEACLKVIIECCQLSDDAKISLTEAVVSAGAAYIKTSTGFAASGAKLEDVHLLAATADGRIGVKAAGGIRSLDDCLAMVAAGATRIGSSSGCAIVEQWQRRAGLL